MDMRFTREGGPDGGYAGAMDAENTAPDAPDRPRETAPPLADDRRVPRPEDAEPTRSKELGGAAPAVGPEPPRS